MSTYRSINLSQRLALAGDLDPQASGDSIRAVDTGPTTAVGRRSARLQKGATEALGRSSGLDPLEAPPHAAVDGLTEFLLALLICFSALAFGATQPWSQEVTLALCGVMLLILTVKLATHGNAAFVWSWAYVPMALYLGLVALQAVALPTRWVSLISPAAVDLRARLLGSVSARQTPSLYPLATAHQLELPFCAAAVFVVVLNVYQRREQIIRLLTTIAAAGAAVILVAAYQNITGSQTIYGGVEAIQPNSGPFMNHGHFAQFTNLALGAVLGLVLYRVERRVSGRKARVIEFRELFSQSWGILICVLSLEIVLGAITVFLSMSRMGSVSLIFAGSVTAVLICARARTRGPETMLLILAIIIFAGLLYAGFDAVFNRLATIRHPDGSAATRWAILRDLRAAWAMFPLIGTGLGTHEFVFPMFDRSATAVLKTFAENEYAQALEETGFLGLGIIVLFLSIILWNLAVLVWHPTRGLDAISYGLLFGVGAALIHSFSDFSQHVPAIAYLAATECALILVLRRMRDKANVARAVGHFTADTFAIAAAPRWILVPRSAAVIAVLVASSFALLSADRARAAQAQEDTLIAAQKAWSQPDAPLSIAARNFLIDCASRAAALEPGNVSFQLTLADQRWESIAERSRSGEQLALSPQSIDTVRDIVHQLIRARENCPTFGPLYSLSGEMEKFVLNDPSGDVDIHRGAELTSYDANGQFLAGQLDASDQNWESALVHMRRAVDLSDSFRPRVIQALAIAYQRPDLALPFSTGQRDMLGYLSNLLAGDQRYHALCEQLAAQEQDLLNAQCQDPNAPPEKLVELADAFASQKNSPAAIELYRRALSQDYGEVDWHLKLANSLASVDRSDEAIHEARICLQLHPTMKAAEDLIAQMSLRPGAAIDH